MAYDMISAYNAQKAAAEASARRQAEIWQNQLNAQKESAKTSYDSRVGAAQGTYDNALKTYSDSNENAVGKVQDVTGKAMRQAYISNQLQQRNIGQQMAAQGRSGGASESTLLGIANTYGQTRGNLDTQRNTQLGDLALELSRQNAAALSARDAANAGYLSDYNSAVSNYETAYAAQAAQIEQQLAQAQQQIDMQIAAEMQAQVEAAAAARSMGARSSSGSKPSTSTATYNVYNSPSVQGNQFERNNARLDAIDKRYAPLVGTAKAAKQLELEHYNRTARR